MLTGDIAMRKCECSDSGCPEKHGSAQCGKPATITLYRCDMDDETGTRFCDACAVDANNSGVFTEGDFCEECGVRLTGSNWVTQCVSTEDYIAPRGSIYYAVYRLVATHGERIYVTTSLQRA